MTRCLIAVLALLLGGAVGSAQQPRIGNARLTSQSGAAVEAVVRTLAAAQVEPAWIAYSIPMLPGDRQVCCGSFRGGMLFEPCRLEPATGRPASAASATPSRVELESPDRLIVLLRLENRRVDRVRSVSSDCDVDAGGLTVYWLTGDLLAGTVEGSARAGVLRAGAAVEAVRG